MQSNTSSLGTGGILSSLSRLLAGRAEVLSVRPSLARLSLFALLYLLFAWVGYRFALIPSGGVTLWPPSGLFLGALLLTDKRHWAWYVLAGLPAEFTAATWWFDFPPAASLPIYVGNALEALCSAWLIRRWFDHPFRLADLRSVMALCLIGGSVGPAVSATLGSATLAVLGMQPFTVGWALWWVGDASGVLLFAPLVLISAEWFTAPPRWSMGRLVEFCGVALFFLATSYLSLSGRFPFAYIVIPALIWAALRFHLAGAAVASLVVALMTMAFTTAGLGPFASRQMSLESMQLAVQAFLGIVPFSMLVVAALARQHSQSVAALKSANEELEARIGERTAKLRDSEERHRSALDAAAIGTFIWHVADDRCEADERMLALFGQTEQGALTLKDALATMIHPDDRERYADAVRRACDPNGLGELREDIRVVRPDGTLWVTVSGRVSFDEQMRPVRMAGAAVDITDRKKSEAALRTSEAAFRAMFSVSSIAKAEIDLQSGRFLRANAALCALTGFSEAELTERTFADVTLTAGQSQDRVLNAHAGGNGTEPFEVENRLLRKDGSTVWARTTLNVIHDEAGRPLRQIAVIVDLSESRQREQQVRFLMREMNHRAKNQLALVQAVARQTAKGSPHDFLKRFDDRLRALAAGLDLLVTSDWKGVSLKDLVQSQLAHFQDAIGTRISIEGPPLMVAMAASQALGMALHELATNAGKYGALSVPAGRVEISWDLALDGEEPRFTMAWVERDGPPVVKPTQGGFGDDGHRCYGADEPRWDGEPRLPRRRPAVAPGLPRFESAGWRWRAIGRRRRCCRPAVTDNALSRPARRLASASASR